MRSQCAFLCNGDQETRRDFDFVDRQEASAESERETDAAMSYTEDSGVALSTCNKQGISSISHSP